MKYALQLTFASLLSSSPASEATSITGDRATRFKTLVKMASNNDQTDEISGRASPIDAQWVEDFMYGYGCYCTFEDYLDQYHWVVDEKTKIGGTPLDTMDSLCKKVYQNYECLNMDNASIDQTESQICDPAEVEYTIYPKSEDWAQFKELIYAQKSIVDVSKQVCARDNGDACAVDLCAIDLNFAMEVIFTESYHYNVVNDTTSFFTDEYWHWDESFDYMENCKSNEVGKNPSEKHCCGSYPARKAYHEYDLSGEVKRECCQSTTVYNTDKQQCCDDGSVAMVFNECV